MKGEKFQLGDVVVCMDASSSMRAVVGEHYTVTKNHYLPASGRCDGFHTKETGLDGWFYNSKFELVERANKTKGGEMHEYEIKEIQSRKISSESPISTKEYDNFGSFCIKNIRYSG